MFVLAKRANSYQNGITIGNFKFRCEICRLSDGLEYNLPDCFWWLENLHDNLVANLLDDLSRALKLPAES